MLRQSGATIIVLITTLRCNLGKLMPQNCIKVGFTTCSSVGQTNECKLSVLTRVWETEFLVALRPKGWSRAVHLCFRLMLLMTV